MTDRAAGRGELAAIGWLCLGVLVFSLQDLVIKATSGTYPVHQILAARCVTALPILLAVVHWTGDGLRALLTPRFGWLVLRGLALLAAHVAYYLAFPVLKLADVVALYATVPLFLTCLAGPVLGERVEARRWAAVAVGFLGAVVMVRPGLSVFEPAALLPIAAALAYSAAQLMARRLGVAESASVMAFHQTLTYLAVVVLFALAVTLAGEAPPDSHPSAAFLLRGWETPTPRDLVLIAACGPIAAAGMILLTQAYRRAEANRVAPFEYTGLIWAVFWGYAAWGEVPDLPSLVGGALIVAAGLYLVSTGSREAPAGHGAGGPADRMREVGTSGAS